MMNNKQRNLLEKSIGSRLQRLQTILAANDSHRQGDLLEDESARLDNLSHIPVDEALMNIALTEKKRLQDNLQWIQTDDAGLCQQCDAEIPIQRLLTVPTTRYCVVCAKEQQK